MYLLVFGLSVREQGMLEKTRAVWMCNDTFHFFLPHLWWPAPDFFSFPPPERDRSAWEDEDEEADLTWQDHTIVGLLKPFDRFVFGDLMWRAHACFLVLPFADIDRRIVLDAQNARRSGSSEGRWTNPDRCVLECRSRSCLSAVRIPWLSGISRGFLRPSRRALCRRHRSFPSDEYRMNAPCIVPWRRQTFGPSFVRVLSRHSSNDHRIRQRRCSDRANECVSRAWHSWICLSSPLSHSVRVVAVRPVMMIVDLQRRKESHRIEDYIRNRTRERGIRTVNCLLIKTLDNVQITEEQE